MLDDFYKFLDMWNSVLGFHTPAHHYKIMEFLVSVWQTHPKRGLLMAFRHSGKSTVMCFTSVSGNQNPDFVRGKRPGGATGFAYSTHIGKPPRLYRFGA